MVGQSFAPSIVARGLAMTFRAPIRAGGLGGAVASLFRREHHEIHAVRGIDLEVGRGEVVGFIGPNGAGKTTTLKMLSGVLHPTAGDARVLGAVPWRREHAFLRQIAMVRGSQPLGEPLELTVLDRLRFQQLLYEVTATDFRRNVDQLTRLLSLERILPRQVRALSLGERMRAGLALALLYRPQVLFLDEPTIGLDVSGVQVVRAFIAAYSRETGATILLTSHYMADVERLCRRVVLIDEGAISYDGDLEYLSRILSPFKLLTFTALGVDRDWSVYGEVVEAAPGKVTLRVPREAAPAVTGRLLADLPISDLSLQEPPLETVIDRAYRDGTA